MNLTWARASKVISVSLNPKKLALVCPLDENVKGCDTVFGEIGLALMGLGEVAVEHLVEVGNSIAEEVKLDFE